jgi:hypothetical protein
MAGASMFRCEQWGEAGASQQAEAHLPSNDQNSSQYAADARDSVLLRSPQITPLQTEFSQALAIGSAIGVGDAMADVNELLTGGRSGVCPSDPNLTPILAS